MPSLLSRILLFLSSYFPLTTIFFVLWIEDSPRLALSTLLLGIVSVAALIYFLRTATRLAGRTVSVSHVERRDNEAMSYIVTYIIPFLGVASASWQHTVALVVFFLMLGFLYINSNMIHINPMMNILGYHLFEVTLMDGSTRTFVTKRSRLHAGAKANVVEGGDDILFDKFRTT